MVSTEWGVPNKNERVFPRGPQILLAHASQTGTAESIATDLFNCNQQVCDLYSMRDLTPACLEQYGRQVFVVATHGEGGPPASASGFFEAFKATKVDLSQVEFVVLALGNRSYKRYCQFGRDLFDALVAASAVPRMLTVEVHNSNAATIAHWRKKLAETFDLREDPDIDWETATVMQSGKNKDGVAEVTFYIQSLELIQATHLIIRTATRRAELVEFKVVPDTDSRFTRILVPGDSQLAAALAAAEPGDKWLAKPSRGR